MPLTQEQLEQYRLILQAYHAQVRSIVATHKVTVRRALADAQRRKGKAAGR